MKPQIVKIHILLIVCLLATACSISKTTNRQPSKARKTPMAEAVAPQKGQVWQLVALRGKAVSRSSDIITLTLNPEAGTISGKMPCNSYYGNYTLRLASQTPEKDNYTLKISEVGYTEVYCNEADMNTEARYLALLPKADALTIDTYTLTLYQKDKEILKYELQ